jgi:hypothetical protein
MPSLPQSEALDPKTQASQANRNEKPDHPKCYAHSRAKLGEAFYELCPHHLTKLLLLDSGGGMRPFVWAKAKKALGFLGAHPCLGLGQRPKVCVEADRRDFRDGRDHDLPAVYL